MHVGSREQPASLPHWREHRSSHFTLRFPPDSLAEQHAAAVAARLETFRAATSQVLGLEETQLEHIEVCLTDVLDGLDLARLNASLAVFEQGDPGDTRFVIVHGEVEVVTTGPTGEACRLAIGRDGEYLGEMALLEDGPRSAAVRTRTPTLFCTLEREEFLDLLASVPGRRAAVEQVVEQRRQANVAALHP